MAKRKYLDKEALAILDSFRHRNLHIYTDSDFVGVGVRAYEDGDVKLAVYSRSGQFHAFTQPKFSYVYDGIEESLEVIHEQGEPSLNVQTGFHDGDTVNDPRSMYNGTGGWSFFLDLGGGNMPLVCISNFHVFCQVDGNNSRIGTALNLNGFGATLFAYNNLQENRQNEWDFALAQYNNITDCARVMRTCNDGTVHPHPTSLSRNVTLNDGENYRKVGNGNSGVICEDCKLREFFDFSTEMILGPGLGTRRIFMLKNQLGFEDVSTPGDSGSIVVRTSDNTVTGLISSSPVGTGTNQSMVANRLYARPWKPQGVVTLDNRTIPIFEAPDIAELVNQQRSSNVVQEMTSQLDSSQFFVNQQISFNRSVLIGIAQTNSSPSKPPLAVLGSNAPSGFYWTIEPPPNNVGSESDMVLLLLHVEETTTFRRGGLNDTKYAGTYGVFEQL